MRAALAAMPVVAMVGVSMLAWPGPAEAGGGLLAGSPRVETVRVLAPSEGRYAGRVVVWVRVDHARGTRRAVGRERPETVHTGRVIARVGKASRVATRRLDLDRRRAPAGYHFRFSRSSIRGLAAQGGRRVAVSVRVAQTVDLDSDGDSEDRALTATTRRVPLARPETSIEPRDGGYENSASDSLQVSAGSVVSFSFVSGTSSPCGVGPANNVQAPIDPQTGEFSFNSTNTRRRGPAIETTAKGTFGDNTDLELDATVTIAGCVYDVSPINFSFLLFGASRLVGDRFR